MATQPSQTEGTSTPAPAPAPAPVASEVPTATTTAEAPQPDAVPEISVPPTPTAVPTPASAPEKVQEEPEPHNSITEKFSNQEWISLKEFRVRRLRPRCVSLTSHHLPYTRLSSQNYWRMPSQMILKQRRHLSPCGVSTSTPPIPAMPKSVSYS